MRCITDVLWDPPSYTRVCARFSFNNQLLSWELYRIHRKTAYRELQSRRYSTKASSRSIRREIGRYAYFIEQREGALIHLCLIFASGRRKISKTDD